MGGHSQMLKIRRTKKRNEKILTATVKQQKRRARMEAKVAAKQKAAA